MSTATVRIPEDKRDILKIIASVEKKEIKEILSELIDEYIARHRETLELLSRPEWVRAIKPCRVGTAHLLRFAPIPSGNLNHSELFLPLNN